MFGLRHGEPSDGLALCDRSYLARLAEHIGAEAMRELLADGLFELNDRLARIEHLTATEDIDGLCAVAHDITSVAGHVGLAQLSTVAAEFSRTASERPSVPADVLTAPIRRSGPISLAVLRAFLDEIDATAQNRG